MNEVASPIVSRRLALKFEVAALVSLHVSSIARGLMGLTARSRRLEIYYWPETLVSVFSGAGGLLIVLFVIWSSGDKLESFGIRKWRWNIDPAYALLAFSVMFAIHLVYSSNLYGTYNLFGSYRTPAGLSKSYVLGVPLYLMVGFREELFFRGYLIARFQELFKEQVYSPIIVSAGIFALVHLTYGPPYALTVFAAGLAFGFLYRQTKSILPLALAHAVFDYLIIYT